LLSALPKFLYESLQLLLCKNELIFNDFFKYQSKKNGMNLSRMHPESFQDFSKNSLGLLKDGISLNPERISELLGSSVSRIPA